MLNDHWDRLERLFGELRGLSPAARRERLESECRDDPEVRRELEALLLAADRAPNYLTALADDLLGRELRHRVRAMVDPRVSDQRALARITQALAGRYEVEAEVGAGGMATVYRARDVRHGRMVAVKVLHPELAVVGGSRFLQEIKVTANLRHPHILPLYDSGEVAALPYYVMPYLEGASVRDRLKRETRLAVDVALALIQDVAAALDFAHARGIVHRDIKPDNVLLIDGRGIVSDFGIALALDRAGGERLTTTGVVVGTPEYMSPEQLGGEHELDARSDVYSLGCVAYELLVGHPPFAGVTKQAVFTKRIAGPPPTPGVLRPDVPPAVDRAVMKALAPEPGNRFVTAGAFGDAWRP